MHRQGWYNPRDNYDERMLPCQNFMNGYCPQGSRCRFYHPSPDRIDSSIRVPPMPPGFEFAAAKQLGLVPVMITNPMLYPGDATFGHEPNLTMNCVPEGSTDFRPLAGGGDAVLAGSTFMGYGGLESMTATFGQVQFVHVGMPPTMFTHINWEDFLLPGAPPPPYVDVVFEGDENTEAHAQYAERLMPENDNRSVDHFAELPRDESLPRKMTPKEEFRYKMKLVAMESIEASTATKPSSNNENYRLEILQENDIVVEHETVFTSGNSGEPNRVSSNVQVQAYDTEETENNPPNKDQ